MDIALVGFPEGLKKTLKIPNNLRPEWRDMSVPPFPIFRRFYDYDVTIINPSITLDQDPSKFFAIKSEEFVELLNGGGLIVFFCNYFLERWFKPLLGPLKSVGAGARTINISPKAGILSGVLKEMDWYEHYFSEYPPNSVIIATDKVGHPIALRIPCFSGEIILLPAKSLVIEENYWLPILSRLFEILPQLKKMPEKIALPAWITSYAFPEEEKLIKQRREIDDNLERIRLRKYLIAAKSKSLEDAVGLALKDTGFTVEKQPEGAYVEFILKLKDEEIAAVEVASSIGQIDVREFRQLFHFLKDCEIDKKEIKGILIGNHFCEKIPKERGDAFTIDAVKAAEKHGVSLIITAELFEVLSLLDQGKISQRDIQTKILGGVGVCKLT